MNIRKLALTTFALCAAATAAGESKILVEAIELTPSNIILPASVNGTVTFKPCVGECEDEHRRARLTPETEFYVDERKVKFEVFQDSMSVLRGQELAYALISVDLEKQTITSIRINE